MYRVWRFVLRHRFNFIIFHLAFCGCMGSFFWLLGNTLPKLNKYVTLSAEPNLAEYLIVGSATLAFWALAVTTLFVFYCWKFLLWEWRLHFKSFGGHPSKIREKLQYIDVLEGKL